MIPAPSSRSRVTPVETGAVPTNLDGPEIDVPEPNGPADVTYGVYPNVEGIDEIGNAIADSVYKVSPIIEDVNTPSVSDVTYSVNPSLSALPSTVIWTVTVGEKVNPPPPFPVEPPSGSGMPPRFRRYLQREPAC